VRCERVEEEAGVEMERLTLKRGEFFDLDSRSSKTGNLRTMF
jgi:hypothetical protein